LKQIVIATNNKDKLKEIRNIWKDLNIDINWMGNYPGLHEVEESGMTLEENASLKAIYVCETLDFPAVADDTGLFVEYLNGSPGVFSSRFAGEKATYDENVSKLLKELEGVPMDKRGAEFRCAVCLARPHHETVCVTGTVKGLITTERRGICGFGYDPVFEVEGTGKTFAEMLPEEKDKISHRYKAFKKMMDVVREVA